MRVLPAIGALVLSVTASAVTGPFDAPPFSVPAKSLLQAAGEVDAKNLNGVTVLLDERTLAIDAEHRVTERRHLIYRIDSPDAVRGWSNAGAEWSPWHQKKPQVHARVVTADGVQHELDPKTLTDAAVHQDRPEVYEDDRVYSGPLPAVKVGAVIEEEEILEDTQPFFAGGLVRRVWFGRRAPVLSTRLVVEAAASLPLKYVSKLLPGLSFKREQAPAGVRYVFESGRLEAVDAPEPGLPPDTASWPYVAISTAESWHAVAAKYDGIVESQTAAADLKLLVKPHISSQRTATINAVLAQLQREVRYTGVEFGEASLVPRSPAETLKRKYGDCKDKATLLVVMLRAAGIPANVALLDTGPGMDVDPELPGMGVFDHAIVFVPGTPEVWIDPADEFRAAGNLPYSDQGRLALIVSGQTTALKTTPEAKPEDNLLVELREFELPEYGPARIIEISQPHGSADAAYRSSYGGGDSKQMREGLEDYVRTEYLAEKLTKYDRSDGADLAKPFRLRLEVAKGKRGLVDLDSAVVAIRLESIFARLPEYLRSKPESDTDGENSSGRKKPRNSDFLFSPSVTEWRYKITPPPAFRVARLPEKRVQELGPARLAQTFSAAQDGTVTVVVRFDSVKNRYTPAEILAFRKAVQEIRNADAVMITFDHAGAAQLAAGNVREALATYRALAAKHPNEALHRVQLAGALLNAGLGEQARTEAKEAIRLDDKSALACRTLGWILQHDLIGRRFEKGFDLEGAVAAYRRAKELDPKETVTRLELAILLEHDANGERYSPDAKLDQAVAEYRELAKIDESYARQYADNLLYALIYARKFAEAKSALVDLPQTRERLALALVAAAATEGPKEAVAQSAKLAQDPSLRRPALALAGTILRNLRMYPAASDLLSAGAQEEANAAQTLAQAQALRSARPYNEALAPASDPRSLVQRFFVYLLEPGSITAEVVREYDDVLEGPAKYKERNFQRQGAALRAIFERNGIPRLVGADLVVSNMKINAEGDDRRGYRLHVQPLGTNPMVAFAARVNGRYRLIGMSSSVAGVGQEVIRRLNAGDNDGARQWLDWTREEIKPSGGDDPFRAPLFPRFWTRGDGADRQRMKLAAISLLAGTDGLKAYVAELRAAREKAAPDAERASIDALLANALQQAESWSELREVTRRLLDAYPTSVFAFASFSNACRRLSDWTSWEAAINRRLARLPEDEVALRSRVTLAEAQGHPEVARRVLRPLLDSGRAEPGDMNNYGWDALFTGKVEESDLQMVQRASADLQNGNYPVLHTLICLYVEVGKTREARELLLHTLQVSGLEEPDSPLWYALGRIAEQYGERTAALAAYKRFDSTESDDNMPNSTWALVQKRMAGLTAAGGRPVGR